jgi:hypothetical protein
MLARIRKIWRMPHAGIYIALATLVSVTVAILLAVPFATYAKLYFFIRFFFGIAPRTPFFVSIVTVLLEVFLFVAGTRAALFFYDHRLEPFSRKLTRASLLGGVRKFGLHIKEFAVICAPLFLGLAVLAYAVALENASNLSRLWDAVFLRSDYALFGAPMFVFLNKILWPTWLSSVIVSSYGLLEIFVAAGALFLFFTDRLQLERFVAAFLVAAAFMIAVWHFMPAVDPQIRYVNNVYDLPVSSQTAAAIASVHLPIPVNAFLSGVVETNPGNSWPVSTFPSAHIIWAFLIGYYLFLANRRVGYGALAPLLLASFGTVFLAQHYFVDIPAGILTALVAIWIAKYLVPAPVKTPL